jgi:predicted metalloprotease
MAAVSRARSRGTAVAAAALVLAAATACATDQDVSSIAAQPSPTNPVESTLPSPNGAQGTTDNTEPETSQPEATEPPSSAPATTPSSTEPENSLPPISEPELFADIPIGDVVNVDASKPVREYDPFVAVAMSDIERWWADTFPKVYGKPFEPLSGGVWAGYPERQTDLPGCGEDRTSYQDLNLYVAFYCQFDDFLMYDDGSQSLLAPLASQFGPAVMGIVLAHEFGHAIQSRIGALDQFLATIYTEQQADCFAGAWAGQAYRGESPLLRLGDADVRAGLIAMLEVRDPVGTDQFVEGGHGSAFDRVGAFQEGFDNGAQRCSELLDNPLPLMPNQFQSQADFEREGNASYDCSDDPSSTCTPAPEFLADDLNDFWRTALGSGFPALTETARDSIDGFSCSDGVRLAQDVLLCPSQNAVVYDEPDVLDLYRKFGDFTLGYFYGIAWAERAQELNGSTLQGEPRALLDDCYTGAWVRDITPDATGHTTREGDRDGDGTDDTVASSPGDLDEAIRMAILFGDEGANVNHVGSPIEKIESFRAGVLGGIAACDTRFGV